MKTLWKVGFCIVLFFLGAAKSHAQPWEARHGMTSTQYQNEFDTLTSQGYRLIYVSGYELNGEDRFAAIWEKKAGPAWVAKHGMTSSEYQSKFNKYASEGYRLLLVNGYTVNNQDKYVAIWEKSPGPPWIARHGMTSPEYQSKFNEYTSQGYRLSHVSGYSVNDQDRYAAIWQKEDGPAQVAKHGMTSSQYQKEFNILTSEGYRLVLVSGYAVGNEDRYAAIWEKSPGPAWVARHGMTSAEYQWEFDNRFDRGYTLKLVSGYTVSGQDRYAAIWEKDPFYQSKLKQPIDTWENIHTFLVSDHPYIPEQEFPLLSRYDFIWGGGTYTHTHKPPIKPEILVTGYVPGDRDGNHDLAWYHDWVIYQCDQKTPAYAYNQTMFIPLDISNPDVIAFQANYGKGGANAGVDGLAADNLSLTNGWNRCGIFKNGKWVQLYSGNLQDPKYAADVVNWAHHLRLQLHKLSTPQVLIINLSSGDFQQPQQPFLQQLIEEVDGVLMEGSFTAGLDPLSDNDWVQRIQRIRDVQSSGVPYYGISESRLAPDPKDFCAVNIPDEFIRWSIASYLMSKEHSTALFMSRLQQYGCALWYPEYEAKVGHPCGEMHKSQNVYMRHHSKALSIVNPSKTETYQVNLPAGREYVDLRGKIVSSPMPAPPHSGHVLSITAGPNFCQ